MTTITKVELSRDGVNWLPAFLRTAPEIERCGPPDARLPDGWEWQEMVGRDGVRWVPAIAVDCGRS